MLRPSGADHVTQTMLQTHDSLWFLKMVKTFHNLRSDIEMNFLLYLCVSLSNNKPSETKSGPTI